ncbi:MAG: preprotein translocase subunit SecG [Atribacterota bacterium]|jgi:preprotein translocase subunit SecG|nr:preprotein translocase subunit SecG [Atribacterota bacterium]MDY0382621.1 preprotein translocase subunit SecG [Atribacterota bacterium]
MPTWLMLIQIILSIALIAVVLFQSRKASQGGGIFGGGSFAEHRGRKGKEVLLLRLTTGIAILFMVSSIFMSIF